MRFSMGWSNIRVALAALTLTLWAIPGARAQAVFQSAVSLPIPRATRLVAADLNGDGRPDLIAGGPEGITVLLSAPGGGFSPPLREYSAGSTGPIVVADFSGNGKPDLAFATSTGVNVLTGQGDGRFGLPKPITLIPRPAVNNLNQPFTPEITDLAVADVNGDGKPDLLATGFSNTQENGSVFVLLNQGGGRFAPPVAYPTGIQPTGLAIGDVTGHGRPDIVTANGGSNDVSILPGVGDGTFRRGVKYTVGSVPQSVVLADFNRDGRLDIAVSDFAADGATGAVCLLLSQGGGTFADPQEFPAGPLPGRLLAADLHQDGNLDLVVANAATHPPFVEFRSYNSYSTGSTVSILHGRGDGSFAPPVTYASGPAPTDVATADFNGDGIPDLALPSGNPNGGTTAVGSVTLLLGRSGGRFAAPEVFNAGSNSSLLASGDFNGDGKPDLIVGANGFGPLSVFFGQGDGTFVQGPAISLPGTVATSSGVSLVGVADFNGDGRPDLVVALGNQTRLAILLGNGDGTFGKPLYVSAGEQVSGLQVGDVNGDGKPDIIVTGRVVSVLLGKGDGTFQPAVPMQVGRNARAGAVADLNGDGKSDVAVIQEAMNLKVAIPEVSVLLGSVDGTLKQGPVYPFQDAIQSVQAGDFNHDGKPDLAVLTASSSGRYALGSVQVLPGNGDGTFGMPITSDAGSSPRSMAVGDFNGDGIPDLVLTNDGFNGSQQLTGNDLVILQGNGDGTFGAPVVAATGFFSGQPIVADFNGDGRPDIAIGDSSAGFMVILNQGTSRSPVAGDVNGDGRVTIADAVLALRFAVGAATPTDAQKLAGDVNGDGKVDLADALLILRQAVGLIG